MKTYTVRYWAGPLDGAEEQITCGYPPKTLNGYALSHSKLGRYYQYSWARRLRTAQQDKEQR
jgi:hypothetical protein